MAYKAGITEERDVKTFSGRAGAAISPFRILTGGTDPDEVIAATSGTVFPVGVSGDASENNKATYAEDDYVNVKYDGIVFIEMSSTGNRYDRLVATTGGKGLKHVAAVAGVYGIGFAMEAWTDGQIIPVMIDRIMIEATEVDTTI